MSLSLVAEEDEQAVFTSPHFGQARHYAPQQLPQGEREGAPHARIHQRAYSPRPAANIAFPTEQVVSVLTAIGAILGARLALFLAGFGVYALGSQAAEGGSIWPMVTFAGFVVLPLVWLSARRSI